MPLRLLALALLLLAGPVLSRDAFERITPEQAGYSTSGLESLCWCSG
ncbi:hypothetical protein [Arenimonas daejeonensis]|nr:hypothetical protein [Arenimonas daejeonensis]